MNSCIPKYKMSEMNENSHGESPDFMSFHGQNHPDEFDFENGDCHNAIVGGSQSSCMNNSSRQQQQKSIYTIAAKVNNWFWSNLRKSYEIVWNFRRLISTLKRRHSRCHWISVHRKSRLVHPRWKLIAKYGRLSPVIVLCHICSECLNSRSQLRRPHHRQSSNRIILRCQWFLRWDSWMLRQLLITTFTISMEADM